MSRSTSDPTPVEAQSRTITIEFREDGDTAVMFSPDVTVFDFAAAAFLCGRAGNQLATSQENEARKHAPPRLMLPNN